MQTIKNKTMAILITLIMITSMFAIFITAQTVDAHTPKWDIPSFPYIIASPNPVGVGQTTYLSMWVDYALPSAAISNTIRRHDYTLTITGPDGKTESKHWDIVDDTTGIKFYTFTPNQVGTYIFKFDYGGQTFTWGPSEPFIGTATVYQNDTYKPGSTTMSLIVQEEPLPAPIDSYPLPAEYWTRPIEAQNTYWYSVSSNWLEIPYIRQRTQPEGTAPNSPHIMWTKPLDTGGVVGGVFGDLQGEGFYMGRSYNSRFANSIVMNGVLYYQLPSGNSGKGGGWMAVDIRTGEEIWYDDKIGAFVSTGPTRSDHDNPARILPDIAFGYYIDVASPNQHGVIPQGLLWSSNFEVAYSPITGKIMYNTTGVPSGAQSVDSHGAVVRYVVNSAGKWIAQWNSSRMWTYGWTQEGGSTPAFGVVLNATNELVTGQSCYDWNITIPNLGPGTWSVPSLTAGRTSDVTVDPENIMLLQQGNLGTTGNWAGANVTAISLKPESKGQILWSKNYPAAPNNVTRSIQSWDPTLGVFVTYDREDMARNGWSLTNGEHLWGPNIPNEAYAYFDWFFPGFCAYGNYYYSGYGGTLYCWDLLTGNTEWTYGNGGVPGNSTFDVQQPWGLRPLMISYR